MDTKVVTKSAKILHSPGEESGFLFARLPGDPLMRVHELCSLHCTLLKGQQNVPATISPKYSSVKLIVKIVHLICTESVLQTTSVVPLHHCMGAPLGHRVRQASERHQHRKWSHYPTSPGLPVAIEQFMQIQEECHCTRNPEWCGHLVSISLGIPRGV